MLNTVMAIMSSKLLAASMIIGMPFLIPRFFSIKIITDGTSTAGDTAPRQNPLAKQRVHGRENISLDITATIVASTT